MHKRSFDKRRCYFDIANVEICSRCDARMTRQQIRPRATHRLGGRWRTRDWVPVRRTCSCTWPWTCLGRAKVIESVRRTGCRFLAYPVSSCRCEARIQVTFALPNASTTYFRYTCDAPAPGPVYATSRQAGASHVAESVVMSSVRRTWPRALPCPERIGA